MVGVISCKTKPKDFPTVEIPTLKQPIIEQRICEDVGGDRVCAVRSICKEWKLSEKDQWVLIANHPIKFCHGVFGVNAKELNAIQTFIREVKLWFKTNVKWSEDAEIQNLDSLVTSPNSEMVPTPGTP